jgi:hypothetical protein
MLHIEKDVSTSFTRETNYGAINKACVDANIIGPLKNFIKNKSPLCRALLRPVKDSTDEVCFVFSLSHHYADGHTYYKILNMFGASNPVESMDAKRKVQSDYSAAEVRISGKETLNYGKSLSIAKHMVWNNMLCSSKEAGSHVYYIDDAKVKERKEAEKSVGSVPFVSTNDIILSEYCKACKCDYTMMAFNYRGREPSFSSLDAGNYENVILLDKKGFESPAGVRSALTPPTGEVGPIVQAGMKMPSFWKKIRFSFATSWKFPFNFDVEGCEQLLHLPVMKEGDGEDAFGYMIEFAIVFSPQPGKTGILLVTKSQPVSAHTESPTSILGSSILGAPKA